MKQIVLAITVAAVGLVGLVAANASAEEPNACEAALFAKRPKLAKMKKIILTNVLKLLIFLLARKMQKLSSVLFTENKQKSVLLVRFVDRLS